MHPPAAMAATWFGKAPVAHWLGSVNDRSCTGTLLHTALLLAWLYGS